MSRWRFLLRDLVAPVFVIGCLAVLAVVAAVNVDRAGYERGVKVTEREMTASRLPAIATAQASAYETGTTEGVARVLGGYKSGRCRVTTDIPRAKTTTQPAPVTECVAVAWQGKSGLFIPDHGPTPTPVPTPEAQGR